MDSLTTEILKLSRRLAEYLSPKKKSIPQVIYIYSFIKKYNFYPTLKMHQKQGVTLVEILVVTGLLTFVIVGMIRLFLVTDVRANISGNQTIALAEAASVLEDMRQHTYDDIATDYASGGTPGNTFTLNNITGRGVVYVNSSNVELLRMDVVVCWRNKFNRVIGEDQNLNGVLDAGEDLDGDNVIDSPVTLSTMLTRR